MSVRPSKLSMFDVLWTDRAVHVYANRKVLWWIIINGCLANCAISNTCHTNYCIFSCLKIICHQSHNCNVTVYHWKIVRKLSNIRFDDTYQSPENRGISPTLKINLRSLLFFSTDYICIKCKQKLSYESHEDMCRIQLHKPLPRYYKNESNQHKVHANLQSGKQPVVGWVASRGSMDALKNKRLSCSSTNSIMIGWLSIS